MVKRSLVAVLVALALAAMVAPPTAATGGWERRPVTVGTTLPAGFEKILDASTGQPIIGFGAEGRARRVPVIFLHGNNDTPFPTACSPYGTMQKIAQFFADRGYRASELWGLGYQGDQCDLALDPTIRSGLSHTSAANVEDLRRFVAAVRASTGARRVDIVAHSIGVTVAREWMRQDDAYRIVRRFVGLAGPNKGIINCSPDPANYFQLPSQGGFTPDSAVCRELGARDTPFLTRLNADPTPKPTRYLMIGNADSDFVYLPVTDGVIPSVPSLDRNGDPADFFHSPYLPGARNMHVTGQGVNDPILGTAHLGIANSAKINRTAYAFLRPGRGHAR